MNIFSKKLSIYLFISLFFVLSGGFTHLALAEGQLVTEDLLLSNDSILDASDLFLFSQEWGKQNSTQVDYNKDGKINKLDLLYFIQSWHGKVSAPTEEITPTPSPAATLEPTGTATPVPSPTATLEPTSTVTPMPSPTATLEPTATVSPMPSPTATLEPTGEVTPIPTPTFTQGQETPVPTEQPSPTLEATATATATPTATIIPTVTPSPTPPSGFMEFSANFDSIESLDSAGFVTYDATQTLIDAGRLASKDILAASTFVPWRIASNLAASDPNSVVCNDEFYMTYVENQTSILDLKQVFRTINTSKPKLALQIAYTFEPIDGSNLTDYLVVEASVDGAPYKRLPISATNKYDAFYSEDYFDNALSKSDFKFVEIDLPKCTELRLSFRFESDSSNNYEGAYLDDIQVYDAGATTGAPVIRDVKSLDSDGFYADVMGRVQITGNYLTPAKKVIFRTDSTENEVPFETVNGDLIATLPLLPQMAQDTNASLSVTRDNNDSSNAFPFVILAAKTPAVTLVNPSPFFLGAASSRLEITGTNFKAGVDELGSSVAINVGNQILKFTKSAEFIERTSTRIVLDVPQLKQQSPGGADIFVQNPSGLSSKAVTIQLVSGDGSAQVSLFQIQLEGMATYDPAYVDYKTFPLQRDQAFTLMWEGSSFLNQLGNINIRVGGKLLVSGGQTVILDPNDEANGIKRLDFIFTDSFGTQTMLLQMSPMVVDATGDVTAEIQIGNGSPAVNKFNLLDPMPPKIYSRTDDWKSLKLSINEAVSFRIYGDNFRGRGTGATDPESLTEAYLFPVSVTNPTEKDLIPLPVMSDLSVSLQAGIGDAPSTEDSLDQIVLLNTVPKAGDYRIRVVNRDSGLYVDSAVGEFITFTN